MIPRDIINRCKELGCCDACCLRYLGLKSPTAFENATEFILKYKEASSQSQDSEVKPKPDNENNLLKEQNDKLSEDDVKMESENNMNLPKQENVKATKSEMKQELDNNTNSLKQDSNNPTKGDTADGSHDTNAFGDPPAKRMRTVGVCVSCIGILQEENWPQCYNMVQEVLDRKSYECDTFACALSAPIATILRERYVTLHLKEAFSDYDESLLTPLKEAWKWSFGVQLAKHAHKALDSGAVSPLLVTVNMEYRDDLQELEVLKCLSPSLFESRSRQRRRFTVEFTRRSVEQALAGVTLAALEAARGTLAAQGGARGTLVAPGGERGTLAALEAARGTLAAQGGARGTLVAPGGERGTLAALEAARGTLAAQGGAGGTLVAPGGERGTLAAPSGRPHCVSVVCTHAPIYLGGRYIKLSRSLPQTPWLVNGRRMMHSSVQEIIFEPIAALYRLSVEEMEHRLKFMSAGREDVDVRCLGDGRPFAIEISDPSRRPREAELQQLCALISAGGQVAVQRLVLVSREDLTQLKKGEETKCKTYEALCIKLTHSQDDQLTANGETPVVVTSRDIENINSYSNTSEGARVLLQQRTPIRVLHRRPLLTRTRRILDLSAHPVPEHPQLFVVRIRTEAGTYVKEWAHGEVGRTRPRLADALRARADILALDVASVELQWPNVR